MNDAAYLMETWHASTRPASLDLDQEPATRWLGLEILASVAGSDNDPTGTVEFVARFKIGGRAARLHEVSRFVRQDGRWFYVDGTSPREAN
jgi:SEC-C motif-containing protein